MPDFSHRLSALLAQRNDTLFGVPGGGPNLDLVGAATTAGMRFVLAHAETAAAIMASTYGLLTGSPAAVVVTRGPGAASVVNGAAQATLDRFPLIVITDTVVESQRTAVGHQQIDQRAMMQPVTVRSITGSEALVDDELAATVDRAGSWPMGAVHIDYDPAAVKTGPGRQDATPSAVPSSDADVEHRWRQAIDLLSRTERPVVIVGMEAAVEQFAGPGPGSVAASLERLGWPVLTTYQAIGTVDTEGALNAGLFTSGSLESGLLDQADLVLTVGFDPVEPMPNPWTRLTPVVSVSAVPASHRFFPETVELVGPVGATLSELTAAVADRQPGPLGAAAHREENRSRLNAERPGGFGPMELVDVSLDAVATFAGSATVTVDAGAHFLAVMPRVAAAEPFRVLISNGLATMGFSVPAAIAAALARPGEPVLAFVGDGGLAMCQAELETIARLNLPITVVVFNDAAFTLIDLKKRPEHGDLSSVAYGVVDYAAVAAAGGMTGALARSADELAVLLADEAGWWEPRLIDARIDPAHYRHIIDVSRG